MATFKISSKKEFNLAKLGSNKIAIRKIKVIKPTENQHIYLGMPVVIETKYPNGAKERYTIYAMSYFNNNIASAKYPATNVKMNSIVNHCKNTTAIISKAGSDNTEIEFEIEYESVKPILVNIYVSETIDGFSFEIDPASKRELELAFPKITIAGKMQISRDTFREFKTVYGSINTYVLQSLTGLDEITLKAIDYQLINSNDTSVIYSSLKMR